MTIRGVVFGFERDAVHRAGRTERSLAATGVAVDDEPAWTIETLAAKIREVREPVLLMRAGAWLVQTEPLGKISPSETGRPLLALGAIRASNDRAAAAWAKTLARCGGDLQTRAWFPSALPEPASIYLEAKTAVALAAQLSAGLPLRAALQRLARRPDFRAVHLAALDVRCDTALRVLQVVTTLQVGGAERVTLDLAEELNRLGARVAVAALSRSTRLEFPEPRCFADLSGVANEPEARGRAIAREALEFGADLVHAHLIRATEARAIKARGIPLVMTLHNLPCAWPAGVGEADERTADLFLACSQSVAAAAGEIGFPIPVRTVWNGIDPKPFSPVPELREAGNGWRERRVWSDDDFVLVTVANPRPQKRLHLLPQIVRELRQRLPERNIRLVLVGALGEGTSDARLATAELESEIVQCQIEEQIQRTGASADVPTILAASDVFVSMSAYEGLSLAQLEALAAGLPVVATAVGGAAEVAAQSPAVHLLPPDARAAAFAERLVAIAELPRGQTASLPTSFTRHRMAARTLALYPRVIERARGARTGGEVWLITNNFSTGGAQSSARRLLQGLAKLGVNVRAITVQEEPGHPTPGVVALRRAGIPVTAIAPPVRLDAGLAVAEIFLEAARARPRAVVFWNLIVSYKILLADGFLDTPIYDVSPGEMYFHSLAKYFADPRPGLPYLTPRDYGARLAGVVVKYAAESAAAAELGAPVHVIPNGIPFAPPAPRHAHPPPVVIGTAARLSPDKRIEDLLDAVRIAHPRLPACVIRIAGGPDRDGKTYARELRRRARGIPIQWCGELPHTADFLAGVDVFAMISEPAGCPNASLEAMAAGLPVVATDVGGASEQVLNGITGRLVARGDAAAFAEALVELARDAEKRARFGEAGRKHVRAHFSMEEMVERYRTLVLGETQLSEIAAEFSDPAVAAADR